MKNIKLGKKELLVVIIVLVLFCLYFIIDYLTSIYKKSPLSKTKEGFQSDWDESKPDETGTQPAIPKILRTNMELLQTNNKDIFEELENVNKNEILYFEVDKSIADRIIDKKFDIRYIVGRVKKSGGNKTIKGKSTKFKEVFYDDGLSNNTIIVDIGKLISKLDDQETLLIDGGGLDTNNSLDCENQSLDDCEKGDNGKKCRLVSTIERINEETGEVMEEPGSQKCVRRNTFVFKQLSRIFTLFKELYESKLTFYHLDLGQNSNLGDKGDKLDFSSITPTNLVQLTNPANYSSGIKQVFKDASLQDVILNHLLRRQVNESNSTKPTESAMPEITYLLRELDKINANFRFKLEQIEKEINFTINEVDKDDTMYEEIKLLLIKLLRNRLDIIRKLLIKHMSFDPIETLLNLAIIGHTAKDNDTYKNEKKTAIEESKKITKELTSLMKKEQKIIEEIIDFFSKDNAEFGETRYSMSKSIQDRYFNTIKQADSSLIHFCKKIRKMDRPPNNSLMFERLANEFKGKKKTQIDKLSNNVSTLMNEMAIKDMHNEDLYKLRTSEDAQKQMDAIEIAKDNINSLGKFKLNIN